MVGEDGLDSEKRMDEMIRMVKSACSVCTLRYVKRTFISIEGKRFRVYMNDALGSVNSCYTGNVLTNGRNDLQEEATRRCERHVEVGYG